MGGPVGWGGCGVAGFGARLAVLGGGEPDGGAGGAGVALQATGVRAAGRVWVCGGGARLVAAVATGAIAAGGVLMACVGVACVGVAWVGVAWACWVWAGATGACGPDGVAAIGVAIGVAVAGVAGDSVVSAVGLPVVALPDELAASMTF